MTKPRVSIVIPAYNEGGSIVVGLDRLLEAVQLPCEVLVVFDTPEDSTAPFSEEYAKRDSRVRSVLNTYGRGVAKALRFGVDNAVADVVCITMADGSDDATQIDQLARLVERGVVVACASRYMKGGQQVGGPIGKSLMSRAAGVTLCWFARVGTHDATNSFKAYSRKFVQEAGIDSDTGFTLGIEMVAKAKRMGYPVAELPTIWLDRAAGQSNFRVRAWIPKYLHWYWRAFRPRSARRAAPPITIKEASPAGAIPGRAL